MLLPAAGGLSNYVPGFTQGLADLGYSAHVVGIQDPADRDAHVACGRFTLAHELYGSKVFGYSRYPSVALCELMPTICARALCIYAGPLG